MSRTVRVLSLLLVLCAVGLGLTPASASAAIPQSHTVAPLPTVGALFVGSAAGDHFCSASVLDSASRDLVLTAAHCINGTAAGVVFAPGYDRGRTPYGVWRVTAAFVAPQWEHGLDTDYDYAILRVAPNHGKLLENVTGGLQLALAPPAGAQVVDVAYNAGRDDRPIACSVPVYYTQEYPTFSCHGYVGGSSGSPWLRPPGRNPAAVFGVIGGLHQGGCFEYTSYSSPFDRTAVRVLARAASGAASDVVPVAGGDGC
jgi:V8-like Glu-specific endopeptidase